MRTALWERSPGALVAFLNSGAPLEKADLYTITLASGAVLRWTSAELPIAGNGQVWQLGPGIERTKLSWKIGVEVDTLSLTFTTDAARPCIVGGLPLLAYIARSGFAHARIQLDRVFWGHGDATPVGALLWFAGAVADIPPTTRYAAQVNVKSDLERLNVKVPSELYSAQCLRTVYDGECLVSRAAFTSNGTATGVSTVGRTQFPSNLGQPAGYFDLGTLTWTAGANAGIQRTVKSQAAGGALALLSPLPAPVAAGDTFTIVPGCDGLQATCTTKFNNLARFKGQPYIPQPETIL